MSKNYYEVLGIRPDANAAEIKAAALKLAQKYNPKKYPGNTRVLDNFKKIQIIYQTLTDSQKRVKYDASLRKYSENTSPAGLKSPQSSSQVHAIKEEFSQKPPEKILNSAAVITAPIVSTALVPIGHNKNLLEPEKTTYIAHIHWFIYGRPLLLIGIFVYLLFINPTVVVDYAERIDFLQNRLAQTTTILRGLLAISGFWFTYAVLIKLTTNLVVTTRQIIATMGLIARKTVQLNHGKFENILVSQGFLGKILGFGSARVRGIGGIHFTVHYLAFPKRFEEHLLRTLRNKAYREVRKL